MNATAEANEGLITLERPAVTLYPSIPVATGTDPRSLSLAKAVNSKAIRHRPGRKHEGCNCFVICQSSLADSSHRV